MNDLNNIKYWLFDLDNTLYDGATKVFEQVDKKMTKFISEKLNVDKEEARKIQKNYFQEYNTTLNGMIKHHKIDADEFLEFVHDVDLNFLNKDEILEGEIKKLGTAATSFHTKQDNIIEIEPEREELGFVVIPKKIKTNLIEDALNKNKIPIIAPLGLGKNNQTFNINGDTAASAIAKKLKARRLILMTNVEGVYDDKKNLISEIKPFDLDNLIKWKIVEGGMIPKIENCVDAVENGVRGVVILDGRKPHSILHEIFSDKGSGTLIRE